MKRILLLSFILASFTFFASAQNRAYGENDAAAKKILDAVSAKYKSYSGYQASFVLKTENGAGKLLSTLPGTIRMKGAKYKMTLNGQDFISDGNNIWTYDKAAKEVTINKFDPKSSTLTPQKLFTNFYDKDFLYKLNANTKINGKEVKEIELTPNDKTKPFFKVLLWVSNNQVAGARIFEKAGNRFTYTIANSKPNTVFPDGDFVFNPSAYPGVEVVDLR